MPIVIASADAQEAYDLMEQFGAQSVTDHLIPNSAVTLVGATDEILFLLDSSAMLHQIPLSASQLRFFFFAAGELPKNALQL